MKKNLQLALALMLGLATTVSAQDWSVNSNTRVNNTDIGGKTTMDTEQMTRVGVSFGGDAVSVNASFNANYDLSKPQGGVKTNVHTATATTNIMSFASVTAGRMALNFGSGRIIGSNDWNNNGNTWDGMMFGINNDFADIHVGYASANTEGDTIVTNNFDRSQMLFNVSKDMGDMGFNLLYSTSESVDVMEQTAIGLDGTYSMANGANLSFGYYTAETTVGGETKEMGLTSLGVDYNVNDDLAVFAGYDMYDENGFWLESGNVGEAGSFLGTGMNAIQTECDVMSFGGSYAMGDFTFGATMYNVTNEAETIDYSVTDLSLGYNFSDNSSLAVAISNNDDDSRMWMSVKVGF